MAPNHSCLIFADGRTQPLPAWMFIVAAIGTSVIGLIPYLALRRPNQSFSGEKDPWIAVLDSQTTGVVLTISTIILFARKPWKGKAEAATSGEVAQ